MKDLKRLANLGFTGTGAAIVDVIWLTNIYHQIGIVLICNHAGIWKAYIGASSRADLSEAEDIRRITNFGAKVPYAIARAAFPSRDFDANCYDCEEAIAP